MMSNLALKTGRIDGVTGLRGLAVIAVIAFHYWEHFVPMGYLGVDIFFVISGYCICAVFYKNRLSEGYAQKFLINRIYRLIPTSSVVIFLTLVIGYVFFSKSHTHSISAEGLSALLFVSNYYYFLTTDYFGSESITKPLLHMWSLATEWQCYGLFALATFFLRRRLFYIYIALLSIFLIFSKDILYDITKVDIDFVGAYGLEYYWLTPHLLEFLLGAISFLICNRIGKILFPQKILNFILIISIVTMILIVFGRRLDYAIAIPLITSITFIVILLLGIGAKTRFLENKLITFIGSISYSLYLIHWPLFVFAFLSSKYYEVPIDFSNNFHKTLILLVVIITSILVYFKIEKPFRYNHITVTGNIFFALFYLCLLLLTCYYLLLSQVKITVVSPIIDEGLILENESKPNLRVENHETLPLANQQLELDEDNLNQYHIKNYGGGINWDIENSNAPVVWSKKINNEKDRILVLFGDSHARQYASGFLGQSNSYKKMIYVRPKKILNCDSSEMNNINDFLRGGSKDIFIAARWDYHAHLVNFFSAPKGVQEYVPPLNELVNFYKNKIDDCLLKLNLYQDDNIFIIGSVPEVTNFKDLYKCYYASKKDSSCVYETIEKSKQISIRKEFNLQLKKLLEISSPRVIFVDPFDTLCNKEMGICFGIINGKLLYSDQNHLSHFGAIMFVEKLKIP